MLQNPRKTLGFKKNVVYKIPPGWGEVNHIQPVAYFLQFSFFLVKYPLRQRSESNNIGDWLIQSKKYGRDQESI